MIKDGDTVAFSGFSPADAAKAFSRALIELASRQFQNPVFRLGLPFWGAIIAPLKISILRLTPTRGEIFLTRHSNGTESKNGKISLKVGFEIASNNIKRGLLSVCVDED